MINNEYTLILFIRTSYIWHYFYYYIKTNKNMLFWAGDTSSIITKSDLFSVFFFMPSLGIQLSKKNGTNGKINEITDFWRVPIWCLCS